MVVRPDGKEFRAGPPERPARTEVADMQTVRGLLTAYWRSDVRGIAWLHTILIALLTWLIAKVGIWIAESAGAFESAKATYRTPGNLYPFTAFVQAGTMLMTMITLSIVAIAFRHYLAQNLHRRWRAWLNEQFTRATLSDRNVILNIQSDPRLDSLDQRQQECIKGLSGSFIGLAIGIATVAASAFEVSRKLWQISTPIAQAPALGQAGSFALTLGVIVPFALLCTWGFSRIGQVMRGVNRQFQEAEGAFRGELNTMFRRASQITASDGERVQGKINRRLYAAIDQVWFRNNVLNAGFIGLNDFYNTFSLQILASVLALPAYAQGQIDFQTYITTAALVGQLTGGFSWLINVTPALSSLNADLDRVTEYAAAIERVQDVRGYFQSTGIHDFRYRTHESGKGIVVRKLELMHAGQDAQPFLRMEGESLRFPAGSWTALIGASGSGKTSFLNALMGQKDYGRAVVFLPDGRKPFYAFQDQRIPDTTLKQLICGSEDEDSFDDIEVAAVLAQAGLGSPDFLRAMNDRTCNGRPWERALSGGQKKRIILARLLLLKPEVAFLDETTAGLDPGAQREFYTLLKTYCPGLTVIGSIHNRLMPVLGDGTPVFDQIAEIEGGIISLRRYVDAHDVRAEIVALHPTQPSKEARVINE